MRCARVSTNGIDQVKAGGSTLIGRHDDSIVGLGFQQAMPFAGRETGNSTGLADATTPGVATAPGFELDDDILSVAEEAHGSGGGTPAAKPGRRGGANRPGGRSRGRGAARGLGNEQDAEKEDGEEEAGEGEGEEEEAGFESVVLSASMDGVVRAWEMLGKSEKYRMRHPAGVEVTSMLVLPGGFVLATGEMTGRALATGVALIARLLRRLGSFHTIQSAVHGTLPLGCLSESLPPKKSSRPNCAETVSAIFGTGWKHTCFSRKYARRARFHSVLDPL